jgi:hypothetical protein
LARGLSLFMAEGFISVEAAEAYTRARELAEQRGDARQLFMAVYGLWQSANGADRILASRSLSARLLKLTADEADDGLRLQAHHSAWSTSLFAGEPMAACGHCEAGRRLYDPELHRSHRLLYGGHDPGVCAGFHGAHAHWLLGYPEKGLAIGNEALALAERIGHPFSVAQALLWNAMLHLDRGEPELALQRLEAGEALVAEQRLPFAWEPRFLRGAALSVLEAFEEAVASLREGLAGRLAAPRRPYGLARSTVRPLPPRGRGWRRKNKRASAYGRQNSIASKALRWSASTGSKRAKTPSKRRCALRAGNGQSPTSCEQRPTSPDCGAKRAGAPKPAISSPRSTAGSPRASIPPI